MANTPSARKRVRQTERRTEVNRMRRSRIRTFLKKVELAIASGDQAAAAAAFKDAQPEIMREPQGFAPGEPHQESRRRRILTTAQDLSDPQDAALSGAAFRVLAGMTRPG